MKNMLLRLFLFLPAVVTLMYNAYAATENSYERVQWEKRGNDTYYCVDITDENLKPHSWLSPILCGESLYSFSPKEQLEKMAKAGVIRGIPGVGKTFGWKVWSNSDYGKVGYEGTTTVPKACSGTDDKEYKSEPTLLQWGCRDEGEDYYNIDIYDANGKPVELGAACKLGDCSKPGLHNLDPTKLKLPVGKYTWKVCSIRSWSNNQWRCGNTGFEGTFQVGSEGKNLFNTHCIECHKDLSKVASGKDPARIRTVIANVTQMNKLNSLTDADLKKIADYINNPD